MIEVAIYTDGSCFGNPGPGGFGAILTCKGKELAVRGYDCNATNNRMELKAVLAGLRALQRPCNVTIVTDSSYLISCANHDEQWMLKDNRPNNDLWQEFITMKNAGKHSVTFKKVAGHSGDYYNERCDLIAKEQAKKARRILLETKPAWTCNI